MAGLSPALRIPAPQTALAALEGASRPCSSSPPREPAGPDLLIAPCPGPCPARLPCLSWSVQAAGLGASWASHALAQCGLLRVSWCWTPNQVQPQPLLRPAECVRSLQGGETGLYGSCQPGAAQSNTAGIQ